MEYRIAGNFGEIFNLANLNLMHAYGDKAFKSPNLNFTNTNEEPFRQINARQSYPLYSIHIIESIGVLSTRKNISYHTAGMWSTVPTAKAALPILCIYSIDSYQPREVQAVVINGWCYIKMQGKHLTRDPELNL